MGSLSLQRDWNYLELGHAFDYDHKTVPLGSQTFPQQQSRYRDAKSPLRNTQSTGSCRGVMSDDFVVPASDI
jgi:hypothetical protein